MSITVVLSCLLAMVDASLDEAAAPPAAETESHVEVALVGERGAWAPGDTAWVGLRMRHDPHWHSYWINPGDSGLATKLKWTLPEGYQAGAIAWPAPQRLMVGELSNFGYVDELLLPVPISIPQDAALDRPVELRVEARWLECEEICVPGRTSLVLSVPIQAKAAAIDARWQALFAAARAAQPKPLPGTGAARVVGSHIEITWNGAELPDPGLLDAFPVQTRILENSRPEIRRRDRTFMIRAPKSAYFSAAATELDLILSAPSQVGAPAWQIRVPLIDTPDSGDAATP